MRWRAFFWSAALRMADNDVAATSIRDHTRRRVTCVRAFRIGVAVLGTNPGSPADSGLAEGAQQRVDQNGWRTDEKARVAGPTNSGGQFIGKASHIGQRAVHLPVSGNQHPSFSLETSRCVNNAGIALRHGS